jgi:hypothetical protein
MFQDQGVGMVKTPVIQLVNVAQGKCQSNLVTPRILKGNGG